MKQVDENAATHTHTLRDRGAKIEALLCDLEARWISSVRMQNRVMHDFTNTVPTAEAPLPPPPPSQQQLQEAVDKATGPLRTQVAALRRKCELLTTLEADGRLENTEIHKAFNEELDLMYDNTQKPESEELQILRNQVKRVKADQFELRIANRSLKRDLELQQSQNKVYEEILAKHGLL